MADTKITKKDFFAAIRTMVEGIETVGDIPADKVLEFIDTQVAQIDAKAAKAKARAGEKKAEGDEISKRILGENIEITIPGREKGFFAKLGRLFSRDK